MLGYYFQFLILNKDYPSIFYAKFGAALDSHSKKVKICNKVGFTFQIELRLRSTQSLMYKICSSENLFKISYLVPYKFKSF